MLGPVDEQQQGTQIALMHALSVVARNLSHTLRNPLGIISGAAQIAVAHPDEPELVSMSLRQIHAATMRAALLLDNLLSFAQPRLEVVENVDVNQLLATLLEQLADQLGQLRITPVVTLLPELMPVPGDAIQLRQVCSNLIANACQAMNEGGTLTVITRMVAGQMIEISIGDNGHGIPAHTIPCIFEPFFTTRTGGKGLGLGLAVCASIVREHDGTIAVCSQPNVGSTFTVCLPAASSH